MTKFQRGAFLIMRLCLGLVFLLFGIGKLNNDVWAQTIKGMHIFQMLPWEVRYTVILIGISEIMTGICLMAGLFSRFFAGLAALQLATILVLLNFAETRDIGLLGVAIYLASAPLESWSLDDTWGKVKAGARGVRKILVLAIIFFLLLVIIFINHKKSQVSCKLTYNQEKVAVEKGIALSGTLEKGVRTITIKASQFNFDPGSIVLKRGEKIRLLVTSTDVDHGIGIEEFKVNATIPAGQTKIVEFIADKTGNFKAYCSIYCGKGHSKMQMNVSVIE